MASSALPWLEDAQQAAPLPDYIAHLTPYEQFLAYQYYADKVKVIFSINFTYSMVLNAIALWRYRKRPSYFHLGVVAICALLITGDFSRFAEHVRYLTTTYIGTLISILSLTRFQVFGTEWFTRRVYRSLVAFNFILVLSTTCMLASIAYLWPTIPDGGDIISIGATVNGLHLALTLVIDLVLTLFTLKVVLQLRLDLSQAQRQSIRSGASQKSSLPSKAGEGASAAVRSSLSSDNLSVITLYRGMRKISPKFARRMRQILIAIAGMLCSSFATCGVIIMDEGTFTDMLGEFCGRNYIFFCMIEWTLIVDLITEGRQLKATATVTTAPGSAGGGPLANRGSRLTVSGTRA